MSQGQRQDVARPDRALYDSTQRSITSRAPQSPTSPSPLGTTLIPRDYLAPAQSQRAVSAPIGKKPNPSPLQTSHYPSDTSYLLVNDEPPVMPARSPPLISMPNIDNHEFLQESNHSSPRILQGAETENGGAQISIAPEKKGDSSTSRHEGQMVGSPPESPSSTTSSVTTDRVGGQAVPRTSSIDSALSSISGGQVQGQKLSTEANMLSPNEIANLIATAGSPENLIQHLLREKQHAAAQNAQLWKLVDKQRAMVLGLNKDLERALKDKERYRKKLKDVQDQPPPMPQTAVRDRFEGANQPPNQQANLTATPKKANEPVPKSSPMDTSLMPSPLHLQQSMASAAKQSDAEYLQKHPPPAGPPPPPPVGERPDLPPTRGLVKSRSKPELSTGTFLSSNTLGLARMPPSHPPPAESLPATPTDDGTGDSPSLEKPDRRSTFMKKAPPAPLNLSGAKVGSSHLADAGSISHSESDYDDTESEELLSLERGRRKTREEDDRDRAIVAKKVEEARSQSKKKKSNTNMREEAEKAAQPSPPLAQRQLVPQAPPDGASAGVLSLDAMLTPGNALPQTHERSLKSPPMSPGLPVSPRPFDRLAGSPDPRQPREVAPVMVSPPLSPRLGSMPSNVPLSPRAPKGPIPLPPNTPMSMPSPPHGPPPAPPESPAKTESLRSPKSPRTNIPIIIEGEADNTPISQQGPQPSRSIFRGYVSEDYPNLLLPPNALPSIDVKVASSRLRPSRHSYMALKPHEEDPVFTLSVFARSNRTELWRVEKVIMALPQLDQQVKTLSQFSAKLPDRKLFSGHSPAVIDARRNALNQYFEELLDCPMNEDAALVLCRFLTEDAIDPRDDETSLLAPSKQPPSAGPKGPGSRPHKEGYLTKRGKNFGGWKARFFVLQGPELKYFESPGGPHLGTIKLPNAQIGKQSHAPSPSRSEDDSENQYRHAFLVLEPKRKDSSSLVRHVLCAESDVERDEWVDALLQYVEYESDEDETPSAKRGESGKSTSSNAESKAKQSSAGRDNGKTDRLGELRGVSYESTVAGQPPQRGGTPIDRSMEPTPSPTTSNLMFGQPSPLQDAFGPGGLASKGISGPVNGGIIHDPGMWGNKPVPTQAGTSRAEKKRSIWGFRQRSSSDILTQDQGQNDSDSSLPQVHERFGPVRPVFGLPLIEAVEYCAPVGVNVLLPAVIYRCIEYLRAKDAASEEGIFRLSGSNVVVRALKERFNTEGDVDFLADDQYYDVHAVASLFKSFLRELPTTVLTRELHLEFVHVLDLDNKPAKVAAFNELVHRLPAVNFALLKVLSEYLIEIVDNASKNKMTVRNVGIVFSPTLNIPAPVFSMFLTDFEKIFGSKPSNGYTMQEPANSARADSNERKVLKAKDAETNQAHSHSHNEDLTASFPQPNARQRRRESSLPNSFSGQGHYQFAPAYEQRSYVSDLQSEQEPQRLVAGPEYNSGNQHRLMMPSNSSNVKAKRRESSMFTMGVGGNRKSSMPQFNADHPVNTITE